MALTPGTRLGVYEIGVPIGEGGMGQVYRATDTTLGRQVAIKILPDAFAADPERLARFEREAKTLASLNHPHIAAIYGFEKSAGIHALVMELVEGEDLSQRIAREAIQLEAALAIAKQIAEALEAAHEQGIIHRDLKPANVKVREDGTVKVLDFGLAKALDPPGAATVSAMNSPTLTAHGTQMGMILGTAAYMSPEQARGKAVDRRADIWAFGCVVYEMLTRERVFRGEEVSDVLAAVLRQDVDWTALPTSTPLGLRRLLERCLDRDAKQRLRDIGEARIEIGRIKAGNSDTPSGIALPPQRGRSGERIAWALVAVLLLLVAVLSVPTVRYLRGPAPARRAVLSFETPPMLNTDAYSVTVSPDGRMVAYVATTEGSKTQLYVRPIDSEKVTPLPGTEGAQTPFWSHDSQYIAFTAGALKRVAVTGGPPREISAIGGYGTWNADDVIVFSNRGLHRVSASGGEPSKLTTVDETIGEAHRFPSFLPDGRHFLYVVWNGKPDSRGIYVGALDSEEKTRIMAIESKVLYVAPGFLLFHRQGTLFAHGFDATRFTLQGEERKVADGVLFAVRTGLAAFAASETGTLVYRSGTSTELAQLAWFDRDGRPLKTIGPPGVFRTFALSPDEKMVAIQRFEGSGSKADLWTFDLSTGMFNNLTNLPGVVSANEPVWSPNSQTVMFASSNRWTSVFQQSLGSRHGVPVYEVPGRSVWPDDWSRDGQFVLLNDSNRRILALPMTGDDRKPIGEFQAGSQSLVDESQFSPDHSLVAYAMSESDATSQVYVASFPDFTKFKQVSADGGNEPHWNRNGKELFYLAPDGHLMTVDVSTAGSALQSTTPKRLFRTRVVTTIPWSQVYAVSNDGNSFLVLNTMLDSRPPPITVVLNWTTGL